MHTPTKDLEIGQCPFGSRGSSVAVCPFSKQSDTKQLSVVLGEKKKEKKQKGGCPVMTSEKKRNPPLEILDDAYNIIYQSPFQYLLDHQGFLIPQISLDATDIPYKRPKFDSYPIYLQHTIFHEEPEMIKIRNLDISQRFFAYDRFREQGNKAYYMKSYTLALRYYERAMSCYQWLEVLDEDQVKQNKIQKEQLTQQMLIQQSKAQEEKQEDFDCKSVSSATAGSIPDPDTVDDEPQDEFIEEAVPVKLPTGLQMIQVVTQEESKQQEEESKQQEDKFSQNYVDQQKQQQKEIRKKYKTLLTVFRDENITFHGQEENLDQQDKDMRDSLLFSIYLNIGATYMKLNHFQLARIVIQDAMNIKEDNSQVLFRMSQALVFDKCSSIDDLNQAQNYIQRAIILRPTEKIFKQEKLILLILNLHNAQSVYNEMVNLNSIEQKELTAIQLSNRVKWERECFDNIFEQEKELEQIEQEMIESGRVPEDINHYEPINDSEHQEYDIIKEMVKKYYQIIEFHTELKKQDQVDIAQKQLQELSIVYHRMKFYMQMNFQSCQTNQIMEEFRLKHDVNLEDTKILKRLNRLCREKVRDLFEEGHYNYQLYQIALKDYFKRRSEKESLKNDKNKQQSQRNEKNLISRALSLVQTKEFAFQMFVLFIVFFGVFFLGGAQKFNKFINLQY